MASRKQRNGRFNVRWRAAGNGRVQSCSFANEQLAIRAQEMAEKRGHRISAEKVYELVMNVPLASRTDGSSALANHSDGAAMP